MTSSTMPWSVERKLALELSNGRELDEGQVSETELLPSQPLQFQTPGVRIKLRFYLQFPGRSLTEEGPALLL